MAVIHLSKRTIDKLECSEGKNVDLYFDDELHGFGVAAYPTGEKSFFVMYGPSHRRRKMTIAKYGVITCEQARNRSAGCSGRPRRERREGPQRSPQQLLHIGRFRL